MSSVIVSGFYGKGNLGDEAILSGLKKIFSDTSNNLKPLTFDVEYTRDLHGLEGINRNTLADVIDGIKNSSMIISGGGGLFQDWSLLTPLYYGSVFFLGSLFQKRIFAIGQSIGPLKRKISEIVTIASLKKAEAIFVRDIFSKEFLDPRIKKPVYLSGDLVFQLESDYSSKKSPEKRLTSCCPVHIGINLRNWKFTSKDFTGILCSALNRISEESESTYKIIHCPFRGNDEGEITQRITDAIPSAETFITRDHRDMIGKIADFDLFITMRLHGIIFALLSATPFLALCYDDKMLNFLNTFGLGEFAIKIEDLTIEHFKKKYLLITNNYNRIRDRLVV
ncbi:polysaccharide pyruvyl transferase family protein, partial [bacterium]|nr:polysaccharide pyruvyl transferase family protein [bacterium]